MHYRHPSRNHGRDRAPDPDFRRRQLREARRGRLVQWPCNEAGAGGHADHAHRGFVRGKGQFVVTEYVPTDERTGPRFPLILTTGRILSPVQRRRPDAPHRERRLARRGRAGDPSPRRRGPRHRGRRLGEPEKPVFRLTQSPSRMPRSSASWGWISRRSSSCQTTLAVRRVWAPTLYWLRMRPVVSSSGKRGPIFSSVGMYSVMTNLPLPRTKPPMCITGVPSGAAALQGHWIEPSSSSLA